MSSPKEAQPRPELTLGKIQELIGDPRKVDQEMAVFRKQAKSYDPMPDKTLILGRQARIKKAA